MRARRWELTLYAVAAVAAVALVASAFLLWSRGTPPLRAAVAALPPSLLLGFIGLASRYLCSALPLRTSSRSTVVAALAGLAVVASGLWVLAWESWATALNGRGGVTITPDTTLLFGLGLLLVLATAAVQYLLLEVEAAREAEEAALRYQVLAREAELRAFKAQVDPHFLFNSLNAVASLCVSRPEGAREMAQRLADFFRLILRLGALERITLAQEVELVTQYLTIEQVRFGDRLTVRMNVDDEAARCLIPPLLLQPLVENAVRHGVGSVLEGGTVELTATLREGILRIVIENPADPDRVDQHGEGIGMQNARDRLHTVSEGRARLSAAEDDGRFRVEIELPR